MADPSFRPTGGGVVMIGDSLTWRGSDELGRLRPSFTLDGEPLGPRPSSRRGWRSSGPATAQPDGLIIELGTVPARTFGRHDLVKAVRSVPRGTQVMLVLPHFELGSDPLVVTPQTRKVGSWMRALSRTRGRTCVADWPAYVGVAPRHSRRTACTPSTPPSAGWARWVSQQWGRC